MRRLWRQFVSAGVRLRVPWHSIALDMGMVLIGALIVLGLAQNVTTATMAQSSRPAASDAAFSPARPIRSLNRFPPYPSDSLELGEEGAVTLRLSIAANGRVSDVRIIRSSGSARLDSSAVNWIKARWRYYPATLNGQPVASAVQFKVTFALRR